LLLLAWGLARWLDVSPAEYLRLSLSTVLWGLLGTAPLLLGLAWMLASSIAPIRGLVDLVTGQIGPLVSRCSLLELGCLAAVAGVSEEVLFRGVVQPALSAWVSDAAALAIASIMFGLVHAASRVYAIFAAIMGLYLGTLFLLQNSLVPPIVAHGLYDFVALSAVATRYRNSTR
jgi:membrane protease YdiL (CAAX protease family)